MPARIQNLRVADLKGQIRKTPLQKALGRIQSLEEEVLYLKNWIGAHMSDDIDLRNDLNRVEKDVQDLKLKF